ncbi:MAG: hypothetical protein ACEPOZ_08530 [Marinifilaceae bacterium]
MDNQISFQLSEEEKAQILQAIETLKSVLEPKLITLRPEERRGLSRMGDKTVSFVEKAVDYAAQYPDYMPGFIDINETKIDIESVRTLRQFLTPIESLASQLDDTMALAGSEAYTSALAIYKVLKNAANLGQPGAEEAAKELRYRFPQRRKKEEEIAH